MSEEIRERLKRKIERRLFLRLAAATGLGAGILPRLTYAATRSSQAPHLRAFVERWVGTGRFPGMVASLGMPHGETEFVAAGAEAFTDGDPMGPDSLFRIYSMTKPITGMMAMQLVADGRLTLDQPLHDILPAFRSMQVQDTYDGPLDRVHPASAPITIRHLLTHTSGIGYSIVQRGPIREAYLRKGLVPAQLSRMEIPGLSFGPTIHGLGIFADRLATVPLVSEPGRRWIYSMGLDVMGRVIEVVTGRPFDIWLQDRLFGPAGMTSTYFQVPRRDAGRLTTNYGVLGGIFVPVDTPETSVYLDPPAFPFGGSGLVSSPRDYDRFLRLLAQRGVIGGRRVLSETAVLPGTGNLMPPDADRSGIIGGPAGFGAGGLVGIGADAGKFGWAGAAGTLGEVNMKSGTRMQLFTQFMPPNALPTINDYRAALKADLMTVMEKTA